MSKVKHFIWTLAALPILGACSQNDFPGGENGPVVNENDGVYMTVNFAPNTQKGTRSFTNGDNASDTGTETGTEDENKINRVLLVLANATDNAGGKNALITFATIDKNAIASSNNNTIYQANAKFQKTDLAEFYGNLPVTENKENPQVNIFLFCNYSEATLTYFNSIKNSETPVTDWVNRVYQLQSAADNALWNGASVEGGFAMTNVSIEPRFFPADLTEWNYYTTESNPFDLSGMNNEGTDAEVNNLGSEKYKGGSIEVHRMAARFDFADGSQWDKTNAPNGNGIIGEPFTYAIMTNGTDEDNHDVVLVKGTIVNLSLVNLFKQEYYLERVSKNGFATDATLLGAEKPWFQSQPADAPSGGNYVVTPGVSFKNSFVNADASKLNDYFIAPFFDPETGRVASAGKGWLSYPVGTIMNGLEDATGFYRTWRYVTENTLPGEETQVNGLSTGVVFKVKLKGGQALADSEDKWDKALEAALDNESKTNRGPEKDPILYAFSGKLYCTWEHVQAAALAAAGYNAALPAGKEHDEQVLDYAASLYRAVFGNGVPGTITVDGKEITLNDPLFNDGKVDPTSANEAWKAWVAAGRPGTGTPTNVAFKKAVVDDSKFTIYQTSEDKVDGWGYYCYYYYWNRHNDNGIDGVMAPMEFATVRNNVYKLAVTRLKTLGHPRIPENDPDEPTPDTPDEKGDIYLTVSVTVKPWVVRFNNIEF